MSLFDRAKDNMGSLERTISNLPVIKEYRDKELRREADRRLRESLARRLDSSRRKLVGMQRDLVFAGQLDALPELERVVGRLQLLIDRIKTAASGYAPFFDLGKVREEQLDHVLAFDQDIAKRVAAIHDGIAALGETIRSGEDFENALAALSDVLEDIKEAFDQRQDAIQEVTEEPEPPEPVTPPDELPDAEDEDEDEEFEEDDEDYLEEERDDEDEEED